MVIEKFYLILYNLTIDECTYLCRKRKEGQFDREIIGLLWLWKKEI